MCLRGCHVGEIWSAERRVLVEERRRELIAWCCRRKEREVPVIGEVGSQQVVGTEGLSEVLCRVEGAVVSYALVREYVGLSGTQELVAAVVAIAEITEIVWIELSYVCCRGVV